MMVDSDAAQGEVLWFELTKRGIREQKSPEVAEAAQSLDEPECDSVTRADRLFSTINTAKA